MLKWDAISTKECQYWDAAAENWRKSHAHSLWRIYSDKINIIFLAKWLQSHCIEHLLKTDLFDEACSGGLYPFLASKAQNAVGMDISYVTVHAARQKCNRLKAAQADVRRLPFADDTFDMIISNSTLDHFESRHEIVAALREYYRVLRPDGILLLTFDNLANPIITLRNLLPFRLLKYMGIVPYYVGATFTPHHLRKILTQLQFDVLQLTGLMHFPRILIVAISRILNKGIDRGIQSRLLRILLGFEFLSKWPTKFLTGHFIGVQASKH